MFTAGVHPCPGISCRHAECAFGSHCNSESRVSFSCALLSTESLKPQSPSKRLSVSRGIKQLFQSATKFVRLLQRYWRSICLTCPTVPAGYRSWQIKCAAFTAVLATKKKVELWKDEDTHIFFHLPKKTELFLKVFAEFFEFIHWWITLFYFAYRIFFSPYTVPYR